MISHFSTLLVFVIIIFAIYVDSECIKGQIVVQITSKRFYFIDKIRKYESSYLF